MPFVAMAGKGEHMDLADEIEECISQERLPAEASKVQRNAPSFNRWNAANPSKVISRLSEACESHPRCRNCLKPKTIERQVALVCSFCSCLLMASDVSVTDFFSLRILRMPELWAY